MAQVEILMATYNGSRYLSQQLDSIIGQSYKDWHLTISDDGSNDDTNKIIDSYVDRYPEYISRVCSDTCFHNARDHFFWLMKQCDSEYIMLSDQDDVWLPNKIEISVDELLKKEKQVGNNLPILVFADEKVVDENLNIISESLMKYQNLNPRQVSYKSLLFSNCVTGSAIIFNKALLKEIKKDINTNNIIMHDWWLGIVASKVGKICYIDKQLSLYRQHKNNLVGAKDVESINYFLSKINSLNSVKNTIIDKKRQALEFKKDYGNCLDKEDIAFLDNFINSRSGFLFYIRNKKFIGDFNRLVGFGILG